MKTIEKPFENGYCQKCKYSDNGCHCLERKLYGKPIPTFAIERCDKFEEKCPPV